VQQWRRATVATPGEWQCKNRRCAAARSVEWAQHFSNASCTEKLTIFSSLVFYSHSRSSVL